MRVLIAAGGTGGHIIPAIALGEALAAAHPEVNITYLCGARPLEQEIYAQNGIVPVVLPARQVGAGLWSRVQALSAAAANTARAIALMRREQTDVVIGMGGYVTGPAVLAGVLLRRTSAIHEANSVPGKTNRLLAPLVDLSAVHFPVTEERLHARRGKRTGMPIRKRFSQGSRSEGQRLFGLDPSKRTLLISGGSQGAKYLYETLMSALALLDTPEHGDVQILWSTGNANYEPMQSSLHEKALRHLQVKLVPFIQETNHAFAAADVAVARAGASTIAEFLAVGLYALYIPLPSAIYDHQTQNAKQVVDAGAGEMIPEKELSVERASQAVRRLLAATQVGRRIIPPAQLDSRQAAQNLAEELWQLYLRRRSKPASTR